MKSPIGHVGLKIVARSWFYTEIEMFFLYSVIEMLQKQNILDYLTGFTNICNVGQ